MSIGVKRINVNVWFAPNKASRILMAVAILGKPSLFSLFVEAPLGAHILTPKGFEGAWTGLWYALEARMVVSHMLGHSAVPCGV